MHKPKIYATKVRHLTDARYFAAQGVDFIGFNVEVGNKEALTIEQFQEIKGWLAGVELAAELGSFMQLEKAQDLLRELKVKTVLLPYVVPPVGLKEDGSDYLLIHQLNIQTNTESNWAALREMAKFYQQLTQSDMFLINLSDFGDFTTDMGTVREIEKMNKEFNCFFQFDMPTLSLKRVLKRIALHGLVMQGGDEEKIGVKSFDYLNSVFELFEEEQ